MAGFSGRPIYLFIFKKFLLVVLELEKAFVNVYEHFCATNNVSHS